MKNRNLVFRFFYLLICGASISSSLLLSQGEQTRQKKRRGEPEAPAPFLPGWQAQGINGLPACCLAFTICVTFSIIASR
jgi:hypothetical protein